MPDVVAVVTQRSIIGLGFLGAISFSDMGQEVCALVYLAPCLGHCIGIDFTLIGIVLHCLPSERNECLHYITLGLYKNFAFCSY